MDSDEGSWAAQALRVARAWGTPPLTVLADRPENWRLEDTMLAVAFATFETDRLDADGLPKRLSESEDHADAWDVDDTATNFPRARMEQWRKANPEPAPGLSPRVVYAPTIRPEYRS